MKHCQRTQGRGGPMRAFTLVELLVVIAIIGVLVGMALPAMQNMREMARRSNCEQNLVRISLALSAYSSRNGHYPIGTQETNGPIRNEPVGYHQDWISGMLPMLDAVSLYEAIDFGVGVYDPANAEVRSLRIPMLQCPSATAIRDNSTCYAGIHDSKEVPIDEDNDGVFILNIPISDSDITDGLGHTLIVGEKLSAFDEDLGWMSGTRSSLRNAGHPINAERANVRGEVDPNKVFSVTYVGGLASDHSGGAYVLLCSGEYQFRSSSMDHAVLQQLASRADGGLPLEWKSNQAPNLGKEVDQANAETADAAGADAGTTEP